jgi:hypothetical protein
MAEISREQFEAAYELGRGVSRGLSSSGAAEELSTRTGLNPRSARDYVAFVDSLFRGGVSERSVKLDAIEYFMERIFSEERPMVQQNAVRALGHYVRYYKSANRSSGTPTVERLLVRYQDRI